MAEKAKLTADERLKKIEQKRAKLAEEAAKIRKEARKKEANVKMKLGGLVWKAGLQDQPDNVILGILVAGFKKLGTERGAFEALGRKKFEDDAKAKAETKAKAAALTAGEVKKVDREAKKLTIQHGPIENLGMPPMTMVFRVKDAAMLDGLEPGSKIRFHAEEVKGGYLVTRLQKVK